MCSLPFRLLRNAGNNADSDNGGSVPGRHCRAWFTADSSRLSGRKSTSMRPTLRGTAMRRCHCCRAPAAPFLMARQLLLSDAIRRHFQHQRRFHLPQRGIAGVLVRGWWRSGIGRWDEFGHRPDGGSWYLRKPLLGALCGDQRDFDDCDGVLDRRLCDGRDACVELEHYAGDGDRCAQRLCNGDQS